MKKLLMLIVPVLLLTGCKIENYNETSDYKYDYADCYLNGTHRKYEISDWDYYKDGLIEITTKEGNLYMISMDYCRLVNKIED